MSKASAYAVLPEAITAEINCSAGHVKFDVQPYPAISKIVSASYVIYSIMSYQKLFLSTLTGNHFSNSINTYAVVRNKEDVPAERLTPLFPNQIGLELKEDVSWMTLASSDYVRRIHHIFHPKKKKEKHIIDTNLVIFLGFHSPNHLKAAPAASRL